MALAGPGCRHGTPDAAADDDRAADTRADPQFAHQRRHDSPDLVEVLDPHRSRGLQHLPQQPAAFLDRGAMTHGQRRRHAVRPTGHDLRPLGVHDAPQGPPLCPEQEPGLAGDRGEDLVRRRLAGHQRGHATKDRVLARELLQGRVGGHALHEAALTTRLRSTSAADRQIRGVTRTRLTAEQCQELADGSVRVG